MENLTKCYAGVTAVRDVSFSVGRGRIVGLLGPNGAGKSTILRVLSCFMPATSGTVRVAGRDVYFEADEVRRRIGYMPENNPLPPDMRVREYLKFRARIKGLGVARSRERVEVVLDQCALREVERRMIGHLSKGFRQRVGLADALVHEPDLVILDEPTIGLDPNQLRAVRHLIKEVGKHHTVLISTHILPEAELTCSDVLVLHRGRILASDTLENLRQKYFEETPILAEIAAPMVELRQFWSDFPHVELADVAVADGEYHRSTVTPSKGVDIRPEIHAEVARRGWPMRQLARGACTLEDLFVRMTRAEKEEAA